MARARNIKPGLCKNEDLAECSIWARYLFACLPMLADREGRLEDRPKRIKAELLPFDAQDVEPLLRELASHGTPPFIVRYQNEAGKFIQVTRFKEHQSPHYSEKASAIKPPTLPENGGHMNGGNSGSSPPINGTKLPEDSEKHVRIKRGSQPPDSLIPDSLIPDSGFSDSPIPDSKGKGSKSLDADARASRLPPEWALPRPWGEWAMRERAGWTEDDVRQCAERFRDHWIAKPGKDGRKLNWLATWRNWVRNDRHGPSPRSTSNIGRQAALEERNRQVAERWVPPEEKVA